MQYVASLPRKQDIQTLKALAVAQYIYAGLHALIVIGIGAILFVFGAVLGETMTPPKSLNTLTSGLFFAIAMPMLIALTASNFKEHRQHTFCVVIAILECFSIPLGTILGVLTLVVLTRPSVKRLFDDSADLPDEV